MKRKRAKFLSFSMIAHSIVDSFKMLMPQVQIKNPIMFVTYIGAIVTTITLFQSESFEDHTFWFNLQIAVWLWITVLFANFAQAIAESRGKAQAASLRRTQVQTHAKLLIDGHEQQVVARDLKRGDLIVCTTGDYIPADGDVIEGIATVDESAITGESAPVIREAGGDRSAVTAGTKVVSDRIVIRVTSQPGHSFIDRMIGLVEGAKRQRTPNEIALNIVLSGLTIIYLLTTTSVKFFSDYSAGVSKQDLSHIVTIPVLVSLLVCLIPTTISALLSAVGIAGMDRLIRRNVIAKSGRCVEAAGDIDLLILDKTGTITMGNRMATAFIPAPGVTVEELAKVAQEASIADETPEGRSIVVLAKSLFGLRGETLNMERTTFVPFTAKTRMSGVDFGDGRQIRKGSVDAIREYVESQGGNFPASLEEEVKKISQAGGTPLLVCEGDRIMGVIYLKDVIKGGIGERFVKLRKMGIRTVMITGDNPLTAAAIAAEAGVDDYVAEATPEKKLALIKEEQQGGHLVAMTGDGTNDAPALAQADVGVVMNTGTQASREAGNMVDLDSNPTKLLDIVDVGKQLLMTRGSLTTFSIANDVAKYFAIIPAIFSTLYLEGEQAGPLSVLNIMHLSSPFSAILSAVIFNALIIVMLIPLALRGVRYRAQTAHELLRNNILIYGLGGLIAPFVGIKLIDIVITTVGAL